MFRKKTQALKSAKRPFSGSPQLTTEESSRRAAKALAPGYIRFTFFSWSWTMLPRGNAHGSVASARSDSWLMANRLQTPNYRSQTLLYLWVFLNQKCPLPVTPPKKKKLQKSLRYSLHSCTHLGLERSQKPRRCRHHLLLYPRLLLIHPPEGLQMLHPKLLSGWHSSDLEHGRFSRRDWAHNLSESETVKPGSARGHCWIHLKMEFEDPKLDSNRKFQ